MFRELPPIKEKPEAADLLEFPHIGLNMQKS